MPLVRFEVRNEFGLGQPELYKEVNREDPKMVLESVAVSGLVGILRQLGDLAEFAADVFHGLQDQATTTASRSHKLMSRVKHLEAKLPPIEKAVLAQTSHIHFAYTAGCDWHTQIRNEESHFINNDLPQFMVDSYEESSGPPSLHKLDKFDTGGPGSCLKRYSDPNYFKRVSLSSEASLENILRDKTARKSRKKRSSLKKRGTSHAASLLDCSGRMQSTLSVSDRASSHHHASRNDKTLKSELDDRSYPFGSRNELGDVEYVFHLSSPMQSENPEYKEMSSSRSMQQNTAVDSVSSYGENGVGDDYFRHGSLLEQSALSSSSVKWEEKTEIVEPKGQQCDKAGAAEVVLFAQSELHSEEKDADLPSIDQTDVHEDNPESFKSFQVLHTDSLHTEMGPSNIQNFEQRDILDDNADTLATVSEQNQIDDIESEPDNYMDALNTIESESENEHDFQRMAEVGSYSYGTDHKGVKESMLEGVAHSPRDHLSNMESNTGSHFSENRESPHESRNEHDFQAVAEVGIYSSSIEYKGTEECMLEGAAHSPRHCLFNTESNTGSHFSADTESPHESENEHDFQAVAEVGIYSSSTEYKGTEECVFEGVAKSPRHHPSNMESNSGSHFSADRESPHESENEHDFQTMLQVGTYSSSINNNGTEKTVVYSPRHHQSNTESKAGSHLPDDRESLQESENEHDFETMTEVARYSTINNKGTEGSTFENVTKIAGHHPSNKESDTGYQVSADRESPCESENEHGFQTMAEVGRYSSINSKETEKRMLENMAHSPGHQPSNTESTSGSHFSADRESLHGLPNSVPSTYGLPNSSPSSCDSPGTVPLSGVLPILVPSCDLPNSVSFCDLSKPILSSCDLPNLDPSKENTPSYPLEEESYVSTDVIGDTKTDSATNLLASAPGISDSPVESHSKSRSRSFESQEIPAESSNDNIACGFFESQEAQDELSDGHSVTFWTNGGLLGLQPSKPPDFVVINAENKDPIDSSKDEMESTLNQSHVLRSDGHRSDLHTLDDYGEINKSDRTIRISNVSHEVKRDGIISGKRVHSYEPTDSSVKFDRSGMSYRNGHGHACNSDLEAPTVLAPCADPAVDSDMKFTSTEANQEIGGNSFQGFGLGHRLLANGFCRKTSSIHAEKPELLSLLEDDIQEQSSLQQKSPCEPSTERTSKEKFECCFPQESPTASPPLEHMKISFLPIGFEVCKLKLKIQDGSRHEAGNMFSSFQLVPETAASLHDIGSDSDDDTFCRSSPCISDEDDDQSRPFDSNSEQWESSGTFERKDQELLSASDPVLDLPNFDTVNHVVEQETRDKSDPIDLLEPQHPRDINPVPPPLPPPQLNISTVHSGPADHKQYALSEALRHVFDLKLGGSAVSEQLKPAVAEKQAAGGTSMLRPKSKQDRQMMNVQAANGKVVDDNEDFLHQIRTKSFSLRPTAMATAKPTATVAAPANVKVTAILEKANAIRQAVGSDDGEDDDWSDT